MRTRILSLGTLALLAALPVAGSTFVAKTSLEMVRDADSIVVGRVLGIQSFWDESGRLIVSEAHIRVDEALVGQTESVVTVRTPGGQVGSFKVEAEGFPTFGEGEHVLLFLEAQHADGARRVLGFQQGHFNIVERRDGVRVAVPQIDGNARLITANGARLPEPRSTELGEMKSRVRSLAERAGRIVN